MSQGRTRLPSYHHISWESLSIRETSAYLVADSMEINNSVWFPIQMMWVLGSYDIWRKGRSWSQCVFSYMIGFTSGTYSWTDYSDELKPVWWRTIKMGKAFKHCHIGCCKRDKETSHVLSNTWRAVRQWRTDRPLKQSVHLSKAGLSRTEWLLK